MNEALDVLRAYVAHGLPGTAQVRSEDPTPELSTEVISLALDHKVQGLLWSAIGGGAISGIEELIDRARQATADALRTCLLSEQTAVQALAALDNADVDARVLKGVAIAHLDHDDPAERVYGDADLLIRRADYRLALSALIDAGFRRAEPPVRGWWEQRFGKAIVLHAPSGAELDLHLAITGGYFGEKIDHDDLWSRESEPFDLAGTKAHGLDLEGRLLHACCHTVLGGGSGLRAQRDVAQLVLISGADWQTVVDRAHRDGSDLVIAESVAGVWSSLGLDATHPFAEWATRLTADPVQAQALAGYRAATVDGWAPEGRSVLAALNPIDKVRFLGGLAVPSRASLQSTRPVLARAPPQEYQVATPPVLSRS